MKPLHQANRRLDSHADMPRYARPARTLYEATRDSERLGGGSALGLGSSLISSLPVAPLLLLRIPSSSSSSSSYLSPVVSLVASIAIRPLPAVGFGSAAGGIL